MNDGSILGVERLIIHERHKSMNKLTRDEIENFLQDSLGIAPYEMSDYSYRDLIEMLDNNGELVMCYDYNCKAY